MGRGQAASRNQRTSGAPLPSAQLPSGLRPVCFPLFLGRAKWTPPCLFSAFFGKGSNSQAKKEGCAFLFVSHGRWACESGLLPFFSFFWVRVPIPLNSTNHKNRGADPFFRMATGHLWQRPKPELESGWCPSFPVQDTSL